MHRLCYALILVFATCGVVIAQETTPQTAIEYNARGLSRYHKRDYDGALADFDKSIALDPDFWASYVVRGVARDSKGDHDGAIKDLDKAIALNPTFAKSYSDRGRARYNKGDYDGAMADYDKAIELDPGNAAALANRGRALQDRGDYVGAIADYDRAFDADDPTADLYARRGLARSATDDLEPAIADFTAAITLDPKHAAAFVGRGDARSKQGDFEGALLDYEKALALDPRRADAYRGRGSLRSKKEDFDGAISDFTKAIALDPKFAAAYYDRSWNYLYQAKGSAAHADAVGYLQLTQPEENRQSRFYMVVVGHLALRQMHRIPESKALLESYALEFDLPEWPYLVIGYFRHKMPAHELLDQAVNKDKKTETRARLFIGMDAALSGERETALGHLRWVKENGTNPSREHTLAASEIARLEAVSKPRR